MNTEKRLLYLSRADVEAIRLDMKTVLRMVEQVFVEKAAGRVEMPSKLGIHTQPEAFIHAMPAYIPSMQVAGLKWIGSFPGNLRHGLPNISGLIVLNEVETGFPYAVIDATWITAARTGAATALSARYLARPDSHSVGIIACGMQGRSNLEALAELFPLQRVFAYDTQPEATKRYVSEMSAKLGLQITAVESPRAAVENSDLVVTSGPIIKHPTPAIEIDWLKPGGFASSVDFGSYWSSASLAQMDKIATDDLEQYSAYRQAGYFEHVPEPYTDISGLVSGRYPGRESTRERTLAVNLGLALEDMAVAPEVYDQAVTLRLGTWLSL